MVVKLISARRGEHVEERVFVGPDADHLAYAGTLTLRVGEWQVFGALILEGRRHWPASDWNRPTVLVEGDDQVVGQ